MNASKKLLLMTILGLGINTSLYTAEYQSADNLLKFANSLDAMESEKSEPRDIASWIRSTYFRNDDHSKKITAELINIVGDGTLSTSKTEAVKRIWIQETTPKEEHKGYFSNISAMAAAAATFVIAASIASYFYFMRPWSAPSTE